MPVPITPPKGKLADVFAKINMSELPAMSVHVQELLSLTSDKRSANYDDLARIILKDFSLTHKVLQFANSAYYALGQKVSTVSMAVAVLGFDSVRDLALGIALFDDFVQAGVNTDEISELLARSFMAALLARSIAASRYLKVLPEEAFICGLMHNLGKIISCIYLPEVYNAITRQVRAGRTESEASREHLEGLDYAGVGREVAIFWNMTESVIHCMQPDPVVPEDDLDPDRSLHCIVDFSNRYVDALWALENIEWLMEKYGFALAIDEVEALEMLAVGAESSAPIFDSIRPGIARLDFDQRLEAMRAARAVAPPVKTKGIEEYWQEISAMVAGQFQLKDCFHLLADGIFQGLGLDRVILVMLQIRDNAKILAGQLGRGDISPQQIKQLQLPLAVVYEEMSPFRPLISGAEAAVTPEIVACMPADIQPLLQGRRGYLFPLCLRKKIAALLYVDREKNKGELNRAEIEWVKKFCDLAVRAIELKRKQGRK